MNADVPNLITRDHSRQEIAYSGQDSRLHSGYQGAGTGCLRGGF